MAEANEEDRQRLIKALKKGNVEWSPAGKKYFERAGVIATSKPDFTIVDAEVTSFWGPWERNKGGIEISWGTVSAGFGTLTISLTNDGKLKVDTEGMGKEFCKAVLAKLVDNWEEEK